MPQPCSQHREVKPALVARHKAASWPRANPPLVFTHLVLGWLATFKMSSFYLKRKHQSAVSTILPVSEDTLVFGAAPDPEQCHAGTSVYNYFWQTLRPCPSLPSPRSECLQARCSQPEAEGQRAACTTQGHATATESGCGSSSPCYQTKLPI